MVIIRTLAESLNDIYGAFLIKLSEAFVHDHCQIGVWIKRDSAQWVIFYYISL